MTIKEQAPEGENTASTGSSGLSGKSVYLLLSLCVLWLDQWTKGLIEASYPLSSSREIIPGLLNFTHVRNSGVAFGLFASQGDRTGTLLLTVLGLAALAIVGVYFWKTERGERTLLLSLGLILGGALGNLIDRISTGEVTDFVDFYVGTYHWHTFNVADSAISVGIVLMALDIFWPRRATSADAPDPSV
jgi:signal peptidase II